MSEPSVIETRGRCGRVDQHDPHTLERGSVADGRVILYRTDCSGEPQVLEGGYRGDPG